MDRIRKIICWLFGHELPLNIRVGKRGICPRCRVAVEIKSDPFWGLWADNVKEKNDV